MRVIVEVTKDGLSEMGVKAEVLERSVRERLGILDVEGGRLYLTDIDVTVEVTDEN